ncbi:MAG TPA: hypothetical protein VMI32_10745 [Candidatus Solibacter sp.]|nr:hypothetical protein [Candidatus Solibacter sp.]
MKRVHLILVAACLCLAIGTAASAQMGMNFFKKPALADFFRPVVGSGAIYETIDSGNNSNKEPMEMTIVGKEMIGLKEAYWLEMSLHEKSVNGTIYSKVLVSKDDFQTHRIVFQMPGAPAMEMPQHDSSREGERISKDLDKWSQVSTESITVPAGTFLCQHWKKKDGKDEVWVNDKVTPFGMVKEVGSGSSQVLVKIITDATDHITGPVTPFDPRVFQQMMMNQRPNGK